MKRRGRKKRGKERREEGRYLRNNNAALTWFYYAFRSVLPLLNALRAGAPGVSRICLLLRLPLGIWRSSPLLFFGSGSAAARWGFVYIFVIINKNILTLHALRISRAFHCSRCKRASENPASHRRIGIWNIAWQKLLNKPAPNENI